MCIRNFFIHKLLKKFCGRNCTAPARSKITYISRVAIQIFFEIIPETQEIMRMLFVGFGLIAVTAALTDALRWLVDALKRTLNYD